MPCSPNLPFIKKGAGELQQQGTGGWEKHTPRSPTCFASVLGAVPGSDWRRTVTSVPAVDQEDVSYPEDSPIIIKDLAFVSSESQKGRIKGVGLKKYLKYFDGGSQKDNTVCSGINVSRGNIDGDYIIYGDG